MARSSTVKSVNARLAEELAVEEVRVAAPCGYSMRVPPSPLALIDVDVQRQRIGLSLRLKDAPQNDRGTRSDRAGNSRRDAANKGPGERKKPGRGKDAARAGDQPGGSMAQALRDAGFGG